MLFVTQPSVSFLDEPMLVCMHEWLRRLPQHPWTVRLLEVCRGRQQSPRIDADGCTTANHSSRGAPSS